MKDPVILEYEALMRELSKQTRDESSATELQEELRSLQEQLQRQREERQREYGDFIHKSQELAERKRSLLSKQAKLGNRTKELKALIRKEKELQEATILISKAKQQEISAGQGVLKAGKEKCIVANQELNQEKKLAFELTTELAKLRVKLKTSVKVLNTRT